MNNLFRKFILCLLLIVHFFGSFAQIPIGAWRDHLSWNTAETVILAGDKVYSSNGVGLCVYKLSTKNLEKLTKINGLSDVGITALQYAESAKMVIVGYANGNIDLISEKGLYNLPEIKRNGIFSNKRINHIYVFGQQAYLSCAFGIVALDLPSLQIKDTYIIGDGGAPVAVNALTVCNGLFYAATAVGIKKADSQSRLLTDFASWEKELNIPNPDRAFEQVVSAGNSLYIADAESKVYQYANNVFKESIFPFDFHKLYRINCSNDLLCLVTDEGIYTCKLGLHTLQQTIATLNQRKIAARDVLITPSGAYWIADNQQGLVQWLSANEMYPCLLNGPSSNHTAVLRYSADRILAVSGGVGDDGKSLNRQGEIHTFYANQWGSMHPDGLYDFTDVAIAADNAEKYYVSSWGGGVYVFENGAFTHQFTPYNSALAGDAAVYCGGLLVDADNRLWVSNGYRAAWLAGTQWTLSDWQTNALMGRFVEDTHQQIWATLHNNGLWVFDKAATAQGQSEKTVRFAPYNYTGTTPVYQTRQVATTPDGVVWVGTAQGPVYYGNAATILDGVDTKGYHPNRTGTDEPSHLYALLGSENILSVAIDGAYRKWFGTENGGVFLIDEDNMSEVRHFTADNSPLFSNKILDMAINDKTGEVFFATEYGIVSYRSDAVSSGNDFGNVYVFPNPVRPDYHGEITVTGLIKDADVKITDVAGNLVHQTRTLGGQAVWNGCNQKGKRVASGVYLVFCTNSDGSKTHITKLLFIN
jgi:ligand-binding sensor domain-containing protein